MSSVPSTVACYVCSLPASVVVVVRARVVAEFAICGECGVHAMNMIELLRSVHTRGAVVGVESLAAQARIEKSKGGAS